MNEPQGKSYKIEVLTEVEISSSFLTIIETLQRIGTVEGPKQLSQVCFILQKKGKHYICHYNSLLYLDGIRDSPSENDLIIQQRIAGLLEEWGLVKVKKSCTIPKSLSNIRVIPHRDKHLWDIKPMYNIGN